MQEQKLNVVRLKSDFETDQEVRWCPGCGDYAILSAVQKTLAACDIPKEKMVFISGIGCSSRFPYYMETYGFHTIHGRAPTIATGLKLANPDLSVWVVTGDGDGLSIGTNHLLHLMRKNVDVTVLFINNQIYGLTKGQFSPTSEKGKKTKSSPLGTIEEPLSPIRLAFAANCGFIARGIDIDSASLQTIFERALHYKGTRFIEIFQNCNVFNDGAFTHFADRTVRGDKTVFLEPNKPMTFGKNLDKGIIRLPNEQLTIIDGQGAPYLGELDFTRIELAVQKADASQSYPVPIGILKEEIRTCYAKNGQAVEKEDLMNVLMKGSIIL